LVPFRRKRHSEISVALQHARLTIDSCRSRCRPHTHTLYTFHVRGTIVHHPVDHHMRAQPGVPPPARFPRWCQILWEKRGAHSRYVCISSDPRILILVSRASNRGISCFGPSMPDISCTLHLKHRVTPARSLLHRDVTGEPLLGVANFVVHWLRLYLCKRQGHGNACIRISTNRITAWLATRLAIEPAALSRLGVGRYAQLQRGVIPLHFLTK
jgi:hypothetical protein